MSPILVRPVREQLEHDRVIRLIQAARTKRKVEVAANPGAEQTTGVGAAGRREFPDLIVYSLEGGRKVQAVVEVETSESVNHLEALAQWAHYSRLKVPFHLYVPTGSADAARRFCADHQIAVDELWTYHHVGDQVRFNLIYKNPQSGSPRRSASAERAGGSAAEAAQAPRKAAARTAAKRSPAAAKTGRRGGGKSPQPPARKGHAARKSSGSATASKGAAKKATRRK